MTEAEERLGALYDEQGPALYRYLLALLGHEEDAEDVMQNLFVKLARQHDQFGSVANPKAYLFAAARNEAISLLRKRERERNCEEELLETVYVVDPGNPRQDRDDARALSRALRSLSPGQREAITLHAFEGMTFNEIGNLLGISTNTVASRYRLGLEKLRKLLRWKQE